MPQKRNPDAAELIRAKTGRVFGAQLALQTVMKGLPLAYSKDMQEDKEQVFDGLNSLELSVRVMTGMVSDVTINKQAMAEAAAHGFSTATDLADWLVRVLNKPFREAHHVTGALVALAEKKGCDLAGLSLQDMQSVDPGITEDVFTVLSVESSVSSRTSYGGTAPANVAAEVQKVGKRPWGEGCSMRLDLIFQTCHPRARSRLDEVAAADPGIQKVQHISENSGSPITRGLNALAVEDDKEGIKFCLMFD